MARKLPQLQRALDAPALASVAYGEIASSLYFALGVVALHALGLTPWLLLGVGCLFLLVALSYAEGTAAIPEVGGAATFVRRAFNDPAGFAYLLSSQGVGAGVDLGRAPTWSALAFALPVAMLAYTGLETIATVTSE